MSDALVAFWALHAARYLWNLSYLRVHPLIVLFGTEILDIIDAPLLKLSGQGEDYYNRADKAADASYYLASLIYFAYFFRAFRWHPLIMWAIVISFALRFVANLVMIGTLATFIPTIVWNVGQTLVLIYSFIDWFRWNDAIRDKLGWNLLFLTIALVTKAAQEYSMWLVYDGLGPLECNSVTFCFGIWWMPALLFFFVGIWAGVIQRVQWVQGTVEVRDGIYRRAVIGYTEVKSRLTLRDVERHRL